MMPSYFFAHGAPSIVLEDNEYTQLLKNFKDHTPRPKAIVLFSAHWEESVQTVSAAETYETIYDFGGFQDELYEDDLSGQSDRSLSEHVRALFEKHGIQSVLNEKEDWTTGLGRF
jgi:4,5-DOPA dioxygenase extradiol